MVQVVSTARDRLPMPNLDIIMEWDSPGVLDELDDDDLASMDTSTNAGTITANPEELLGDVLDTIFHPGHCPTPLNITIAASTEKQVMDTVTEKRKQITIRNYFLNGTETDCLQNTSPATEPRRQAKGKRKKKTTFTSHPSQQSILQYFQNLNTIGFTTQNSNKGEKRKLDGTEESNICTRKRPALAERDFSTLNPVIKSKGGVKPRVRRTEQPSKDQLPD